MGEDNEMECPKCKETEPPQGEFCTQCGARLEPDSGPIAGAEAKLGEVVVNRGEIDTSTSVTHDEHTETNVQIQDNTRMHVHSTDIEVQENFEKKVEGSQYEAQTINIHKREEMVNCVLCGCGVFRDEAKRCLVCGQFVCPVHFDGLKVKCTRCASAAKAKMSPLVLGVAALVLALAVAAWFWPSRSQNPPQQLTIIIPTSVSTTTATPTTALPPPPTTTTIPAPRTEGPDSLVSGPLKAQGVAAEVETVLQLAYAAKLQEPAPSAAIEVVVRPAGRETWRQLRNGEELSNLDKYRICFSPEAPAHFYVFQIDTTGKLDWLFPKNRFEYSFGWNPVPAGATTQVPGDARAFFLDRNVGVEHLYIVATRDRWDALEAALLTASSSSGGTRISSPFRLTTRGVRGVAETLPVSDSPGAPPSEPKRLTRGKFGVLVEECWFSHVAPPAGNGGTE